MNIPFFRIVLWFQKLVRLIHLSRSVIAGDLSKSQSSGVEEDKHGQLQHPMITVVDEPALLQYQSEVTSQRFNRLGASAIGYDKARYYRDRLKNYPGEATLATGFERGSKQSGGVSSQSGSSAAKSQAQSKGKN